MANFPTSLDGDATLLFAKNFIRTTVRVTMTNSQTTIPVVDANNFPDPAGATYYVVIDAPASASREICGYTGRDLTGGSNVLTGVTRGQGGTAATTHLAGVLVELNIVAAYHDAVKSALVAIETKVGVDASAVTTTHDYKLGEVTSSDKAVSKTATQTLTNKTLTAPVIGTSVTFSSASTSIIAGATDIKFRNNANTFDNLVIADSGATTFRSTVSGITTLTATTLAGTLSTAAQANVTSVGTLTSLTVSGALAAGATTVTGRLTVTGNIEYRGLNESNTYWMDF